MFVNKKGFFFSTDALIALGIIIFVLAVAYPISQYFSFRSDINSDVLVVLSNLKIGEVNSIFAKSLISNGIVTSTEKNLLEQIGEFYVTNISLAKQLGEDSLQNLDSNENVGIWFGNTLIASKNKTPIENAREIDTARQIISGIKEGESAVGYSARAYLSSKARTKYIYFGGYVGDGNISLRVEYNGNLTAAEFEIAINEDFEVFVNGFSQGNFAKSETEFKPKKYPLSVSKFNSGTNVVELKGKNLHISGGYLKINYESSVEYESSERHYFPGIRGVINLYDGFYSPTKIDSMSVFLHLNSNYSTYLTIGNATIYKQSGGGDVNITINNSEIESKLNYSDLSMVTVPIRLGMEEFLFNGSIGTGGNADVVLITDTSGSMAWRMDLDDAAGTLRACNDTRLNDSSTARISLAKCVDLSFVKSIIDASSSNRVALVSFSTAANSYTQLTNDLNILNNTIMSYSAYGGTCISCAINRAYEILRSQSSQDRKKFIIAMTDGVPNYRSLTTCSDFTSVGGDGESSFASPEYGNILRRLDLGEWIPYPTYLSGVVRDIDIHNSTFGFSVGTSATIKKWNGLSWVQQTAPTDIGDINGIDIYNSTFALAVSSSGKVLRWNGVSWQTVSTISGTTLHSVSIYNSTTIVVAGEQNNKGRIFSSKDGGSTWTSEYNSGKPLRGVKIINSSLAFAVGDGGLILRRISGTTWSSVTSPINKAIYEIDARDGKIFAVGGDDLSGLVLSYYGNSWIVSYSNSGPALLDIVINNNKAYAVGYSTTIIEYDGSLWKRTFDIPLDYRGNLTSGIYCGDSYECSESNSFPSMNSVYSSCRAHNELGAKVYSVGFGPVATCGLAINTLRGIANCGNGTYYSSDNASILQQFYSSIASEIIRITFSEQGSQITGNITAVLYPDSYIEFNYSKPSIPYGIILSYEKEFDDSESANFSLPVNSTVIEAGIVSYSGPRWTTNLIANNQVVYNLSRYGSQFTLLGDPYWLNIPLSKLNLTNSIVLKTGVSPANITYGSKSNKVILIFVKNASSYSPIKPKAEGCFWNVQFFDYTNLTLAIPSSYSGIEECYYLSGMEQYNNNDAIQVAGFNLLKLLDLDSDGKLDIRISNNDITIGSSQIKGIPYTWSTEAQVRKWR